MNHVGKQIQTSRQWRSIEGSVDRHHEISSRTISPDGQTVLTGSMRGVVGIWNAENLRYLGSLTPSTHLRQKSQAWPFLPIVDGYFFIVGVKALTPTRSNQNCIPSAYGATKRACSHGSSRN